MPALYVENIPDELYRALRRRARENRKSIAAEVISLLERNIPTAKELQGRREFYKRMAELRACQPDSPGPFPTAEEMIREDRDR
jgi:plasmid stability protein